jgi:two-component system response regulator AtoC
MNYKWYGNVRELENTIERAIVLADGEKIVLENLPMDIQTFQEKVEILPLTEEEYSIKKSSKALEMMLIRRALKRTKGNHTHAARLLEISHRALLYKIKEYGITEGMLEGSRLDAPRRKATFNRSYLPEALACLPCP